MATFKWFGDQEHRVFNYRPRHYDEAEEERRRKFGAVDGNQDTYAPGSYIRGSFRDGHYSKERGHANKAQNIIGLVGLLLVVIVLVYIAKFYTLL